MRQATGLSMYTRDERFEELETRLVLAHQYIEKLIKVLYEELKLLKEYHLEWKRSIEVFIRYMQFDLVRDGEEQARKLYDHLDHVIKEAHEVIEDSYHYHIVTQLRHILALFEDPYIVIKTRYEWLLDHDRCRDLREKQELILDPKLVEGEQTYCAINAQLIEELPIFLDYVASLVGVCLEEWSHDVMVYYKKISTVLEDMEDGNGILDQKNKPSLFTTAEILSRYYRYHLENSRSQLDTLSSLHETTRYQGSLIKEEGKNVYYYYFFNFLFSLCLVINAMMTESNAFPESQLSTSSSSIHSLYRSNSSMLSSSSLSPQSGKVYGVSLYDYSAHYPDDLSLKTGDRLILIDNPLSSSDWQYVELIKTRQQGFVPTSYITLETETPDHIETSFKYTPKKKT
jgi:hypothetical protein